MICSHRTPLGLVFLWHNEEYELQHPSGYHKLYADDTLLFCRSDNDELKFISWTLMWFEAVSGLKINLNKSEILPIGPVANMEELASELGCKIGSLPTTYLGLPLGAKH